MVRLRYLGVTCPRIKGKARGWVAQSKVAGVWRSGFASQEQAAAWLASMLRVKKASLRRSTSKRCSPPIHCAMSSFKGVVPHRHTKDGAHRWAARVHGRWLGTFGSQVEAANVVARELGVSRRKLLRKTPFSAKRARQVFRAAFRVFRRYVPGDLRISRLQEHQCRRAFLQDCAHAKLSNYAFFWR